MPIARSLTVRVTVALFSSATNLSPRSTSLLKLTISRSHSSGGRSAKRPRTDMADVTSPSGIPSLVDLYKDGGIPVPSEPSRYEHNNELNARVSIWRGAWSRRAESPALMSGNIVKLKVSFQAIRIARRSKALHVVMCWRDRSLS